MNRIRNHTIGVHASSRSLLPTPTRIPELYDDFADLSQWWVYNGLGHDGNGLRSPSAVAVSSGIMTITGTADGTSGGMMWANRARQYGRWEVRARATAGALQYHPVLLLWPPEEIGWPAGGEVDFMEINNSASRQLVGYNLHHMAGPGGAHAVEEHSINIDATQWHVWAVEWSAANISVFVDGTKWAETTDPARIPDWPMSLCLQLDNFGGDVSAGGTLQVDWVRYYAP